MNMEAITGITVTEDVALITLRNAPADMSFIARVFHDIAQKNINVDMISQTAPLSGKMSLSFTVSDEDIGAVLEVFASLRSDNPAMKSDIGGGNYKISLRGELMRSMPGVAASVFDTIAEANTDIRIITTSETDISILIPKSDYQAVADTMEREIGMKIEITAE